MAQGWQKTDWRGAGAFQEGFVSLGFADGGGLETQQGSGVRAGEAAGAADTAGTEMGAQHHKRQAVWTGGSMAFRDTEGRPFCVETSHICLHVTGATCGPQHAAGHVGNHALPGVGQGLESQALVNEETPLCTVRPLRAGGGGSTDLL